MSDFRGIYDECRESKNMRSFKDTAINQPTNDGGNRPDRKCTNDSVSEQRYRALGIATLDSPERYSHVSAKHDRGNE